MPAERAKDDKNYYIYNQYGDNTMPPVGPIGLVSLQISEDFSDSINYHLRNRRSTYLAKHPELTQTPGFIRLDYRIPYSVPRFSSGEGKAVINQSVRGHDLFIITDILNYDVTYERFGQDVSTSPDDHYQNLLRVILASSGQARRINVIMPYLYESRQYRRAARESLDCAYMLKQLTELGVSNIITFDAHDGRIANAIPAHGFETIPTSFQIIESILTTVPDLDMSPGHFMVISPDETGISRGMYYASMLEVPLGIYYRQYDYTKSVSGRNPIVGFSFLGDNVDGQDVLVVDDMIVTGGTLLRIAKDLKSKGAKRIFWAASFAQLTNGTADIDKAYAEGLFDQIFATNLIFRSEAFKQAPYFTEVNLSRFVALLIDAINHDASLSTLISPTQKIQRLLDYHRRRPSN